MAYNGFNGTNKNEDDTERAKAGGIIAGFNQQQNLPQYNTDVNNTLGNQYSSELNRIISKYTNVQPQLQHLDQIRQNIVDNQDKIDKIDDEAAQDPLFSNDFKNGTNIHTEEFFRKYPMFKQLQEQQDNLEDQYQNDPYYNQHLQMLNDFQNLNNNDKFKNIINLLKK